MLQRAAAKQNKTHEGNYIREMAGASVHFLPTLGAINGALEPGQENTQVPTRQDNSRSVGKMELIHSKMMVVKVYCRVSNISLNISAPAAAAPRQAKMEITTFKGRKHYQCIYQEGSGISRGQIQHSIYGCTREHLLQQQSMASGSNLMVNMMDISSEER